MSLEALSRALAQEPDLLAERDLPRIIERVSGHRPDRHCVRRWRQTGIVADDGSRVRLRGLRIGGRRFVAKADLLEFVARLTGERSLQATPAARQRNADRIAREARL